MTRFCNVSGRFMAALVCGLLLSVSAIRAEGATGPLTCSFTAGSVKTFENGAFKDEKTEPLNFVIEEIDLIRQAATLKMDQGKGELKIVRAIGANHFLEVVTEGFLNMTTVYDAPDAGGPRPAVHSRHFGFFGAPFVSQYYGTCTDK